ncbi:hypothetical protein SAMN05428945_4055 [Streptomyces sp. 2224.1]|uniref:hypothetical protein n=1 Tax=unclassified Streptomyces TaxID=2593676 RepID=UPI000891F307|nr:MULTISPECIES: hypothetical protein [unclassified Streptomyces]PBC81407.1 hypothetical protein BX261_1282 [Streptomyces sp. 2321.6]SDR55157.1 hypothetical protein SAMN05216511_5934 [Streptomyces sp. KS_16]SEC13961.1 hypothetical protein SAMN05428940_1282 [Streptomyces sp. 2133.1]SED16987.1 hypothetical protein SAMN05428945_4055 [Streptomyces sp. 2224.1]SEF08120.1 hypothetical protein SAMN05428954_5997 [Streptomyces sp. 2112.3]
MKRASKLVSRAAVVVAGVAIAAGATTAFADMQRYTSGAHSWRRDDGHQVGLKDTKGDGNSVKAEYNRNSSEDIYTLWNHSGEGTKVYSNRGGRVWDMRVCTEIDKWPDDCSNWWSDDQRR